MKNNQRILRVGAIGAASSRLMLILMAFITIIDSGRRNRSLSARLIHPCQCVVPVLVCLRRPDSLAAFC
jgi:hypothetical protein